MATAAMGTTTATAIFPPLLSPPLEPPLGLIAPPDVVDDDGGNVDWLPPVGDAVSVVIVTNFVEVDGSCVGVEVSGSVGVLVGGVVCGVDVEGGGGGAELLDDVVGGGGGGGSDDDVVGAGGVVVGLGGVVEGSGVGGSAVEEFPGTSPPEFVTLADMVNIWRLRRGKTLYGTAMLVVWSCLCIAKRLH